MLPARRYGRAKRYGLATLGALRRPLVAQVRPDLSIGFLSKEIAVTRPNCIFCDNASTVKGDIIDCERAMETSARFAQI
jgi:hypothetical protein